MVQGEESTTAGARGGEGLKIDGKPAIGVVTAAIKGALLFIYLLHQLAATLGTADANLNPEGLGKFTIREAAAGEKLSVTAYLDSQGLAAVRAGFLNQLLW